MLTLWMPFYWFGNSEEEFRSFSWLHGRISTIAQRMLSELLVQDGSISDSSGEAPILVMCL